MQLAATDVDGEHEARAIGQQHLGEAAGRGADVEADVVLDLDRILFQRTGQLDAAARDKDARAAPDNTASAAMTSDAFATGLPSAITSPASIAARARARLSNRPRSTSSTSTRLRGEVSLALFVSHSQLICRRRDPPRDGRTPRTRKDRARYPRASRAASPAPRHAH